MKINYRILDVIENEHSIVVRYYTDIVTEEKLVSQFNEDGTILMSENGYPLRCRTDYNINIFDTPTPNVATVIESIKRAAPAHWLKMQENIINSDVDTSMNEIKPLVTTNGSFDYEFFDPSANT